MHLVQYPLPSRSTFEASLRSLTTNKQYGLGFPPQLAAAYLLLQGFGGLEKRTYVSVGTRQLYEAVSRHRFGKLKSFKGLKLATRHCLG